MSAPANGIFGPPIAPDAPYDALCVAAFVTALVGFPGAWVLAILGASRATLNGRKGRVLAVVGGGLGALWTALWAIVLLIWLAS